MDSFPPHAQRVCFSSWLPRQPAEVWPFFCDPHNLERLTPPFLRFRVLRASGPLEAGTTIDYALRVRGIPLRWRSELLDWQPGAGFVDHAVRGPFALWHHQHLFAAERGGTRMTDIVHYAVPGGRLGRWLSGWLVDRDVRKIFAYREKAIREIFPGPTPRKGIGSAASAG